MPAGMEWSVAGLVQVLDDDLGAVKAEVEAFSC